MIHKKIGRKNVLEEKISLLLIIATIIMGIGYASVNSIILDISGDLLSYSNEDIAFKTEGLNNNDVINSKESITFNIVFYYKDNVLASSNLLESYLNFVFRRNCNIEYLNIAEDNLPTSIFEGESLI